MAATTLYFRLTIEDDTHARYENGFASEYYADWVTITVRDATLSQGQSGKPALNVAFDPDTYATQVYQQHEAIAPVALPVAVAMGADSALTYALAPDLPEGLSFDAATRTISGMPTEAMGETTYVLTAVNAEGEAAILTFTIAVEGIPSFGDATVAAQTHLQNRALEAVTLPAAMGGDGALTYALAPDVPAGLVLDVATRVLSGTPTAPMTETEYTWTATDRDGDGAELRFTIAIEVSDRVRLGAINEAVLPELSRAMRTSSLDALTGRMDREGIRPVEMNAESALSFVASKMRESEYAVKEGTWSLPKTLGGSSFAIPLSHNHASTPNAGRGTSVALWGASDFRSLSLSSDAPISWDGDLFGVHLDADMRFGNGLIASWRAREPHGECPSLFGLVFAEGVKPVGNGRLWSGRDCDR